MRSEGGVGWVWLCGKPAEGDHHSQLGESEARKPMRVKWLDSFQTHGAIYHTITPFLQVPALLDMGIAAKAVVTLNHEL